MVSFGVDYAFHSIGRYREEREAGYPAAKAAAAGGAAVSGALVLATMSDSAAFLANLTAGIESVVQFGIARVVAGEARTFAGARTFMEQNGVEVVDLDLEECSALMQAFIDENPALWNEDIGV